MEILNLVQGSPEWLAYRARTFNASEAAAMMGVSPYTTRNELLRQKATGDTPDVDSMKQRIFDKGHEAEAMARPIVEAKMEDDLFPTTGMRVVDEMEMLASFDGLTMDGETAWENKLWNASLVAKVCAEEIPETHWPQLEHQLLVSGAKRVYFTVSDGTEKNTVGTWYESMPERRAQVIAGWKQFQIDLANYKHVESAPVPVAASIEALPALFVQVEGRVVTSNLKAYREAADAFISNIKTDLQTDQDFADADKMVLFCGDAEKRLELVKVQALSQTASIDELFKTIDGIRDGLRAKRLELDRIVKSRKDSIRAEIRQGGIDALAIHIAMLNKRLGKPYMPAIAADFAGVMKNKRSIVSLRDAVDTELAKAKIAANEVADRISFNLSTQDELAADHAFLFADTAQIVLKANDDFAMLVKQRISDHKEIEAKRQAEETTRKAIAQAAAPKAVNIPAPAAIKSAERLEADHAEALIWNAALDEEKARPTIAHSEKEEVWSVDEEGFSCSSLGELIDNNADILTIGRTVYAGTADRPTMRQLCDADDIIEMMSERAYEIAGEYADGFPDVDQEAKDGLNALLAAWMEKHCSYINFYAVSNIREYVLTADDLCQVQKAA